MITVAYLPAWLDACALYRMFLPHLHTPGSRFLFNVEALPYDDFADASVVVVQRQCTGPNVKALRRFRELGIRIVYDLDDNLWAMPATNPHKKIFESLRDGFAECIELSDILTVSTPGLRTAVRAVLPKLKKEIVVVPNAIDLDLLRPPQIPRGLGTVVGYCGTNTHVGDVNDAWDAIVRLLRGSLLPAQAGFEFVGMPPPRQVLGDSRVRVRAFVPVSEFFARFSSWGWDLALAPLQESRFNNSKSNIKMLEAAAVGIPILVSNVGPYAAFCSLDPELRYLICHTRAQWETKIVELVSEPARRDYYAGRLRKIVEDAYDVRQVARQWQSVFERAVA